MNDNNNLAQDLLKFYDREARELPFRINPKPYYTWISEIMLQQTRMETAVPYFNRFIEALPTIQDLAEVADDQLMKLWEGLGYYSRARNLKKAAQVIQSDFWGVMPSAYEELIALPGIGPYTGGAIASIAFGQAVPAVDGNVMRVFSRVKAYEKPVMTATGRRFIYDAVRSVMSGERPGDFNQAVMELGATICLPNGAPLCEKCPINAYCKAYQTGDPLDYPVLPVKKARKIEEKTVFLIYQNIGETRSFMVERRPEGGLLSGMYQFPMKSGHQSEEETRKWILEQGITDFSLKPGKRAKHIFSHIEWHMISYEVQVFCSKVGEPSYNWNWVSGDELELITLPTAFKTYRAQMADLLNPSTIKS